MSLIQTLREEAIYVDEHPSMAEHLMKAAADEIESLTAERDRLWKALEWIASDLGPNVGVGAYWRQRTALIALGREWPEEAIAWE